MEQLSLVLGYNVWTYFKNWGMPVTETSLAKVNHLNKYLCKRHPDLTS